MALDLRLDAKMTQSLVMSPRMQQAIKILQYNHMEMVTHIQEVMLENPALEAVSDETGTSEIDKLAQAVKEKADLENSEQNNGGDTAIDWERFLEQMGDRKGLSSLGGTIHDELPPIETNLTYGESLSEHLLWQLQMMLCNEDERRAAEAIIHNLDHRGWLEVPIEEAVKDADVDLETAENALELVQGLDPIGCGARDLVECLVLQAKAHFPEDENFARILTKHLPNLERRNYTAIARDLGLELEDVIEYHRMIQELEPHPGRAFSNEEPRYITPDVYVEKHGDEWVITLNEEGVPDLRLSAYYKKILQNRNASKSDREYLIEKLQGAKFLIKSINKRRSTIRRVVESILKFQHDFFEHGAGHLRPLVLQDVASDIDVHMSTVSRVTTNKYVHTPHGIFELKYFFSAGVRQMSGEDMAAEAVKSRIKALVSGEDARRPLSDQQITDNLKKEGVKVARRTVAKYREAMGILPSNQRKQMF